MPLKSFKANIENYLNYTILIYIFSLPLSRAGINIFSGVIILLWLLKGKMVDDLRKINRTYIAIFTLGLWMLTSYIWSDNLTYANFYTFKYFHYFLISFIIYTNLKKEFINKALVSFISGIFISELISYSIFFEIYHKDGVSPSDPTPFMHHIEYSFYLAVASVILIDRFLNIRGWDKEKIFSIIFFTTISFNLFIVNGRTGQFVYIATLFITALIYFRVTIKTVVVGLIVSSIAFISLYTVSPNFQKKVNKTVEIFDKKIDPCSADGNRVYMVKIGNDIFKDNPFGGVGVGDAMDKFEEYVKKSYPESTCSLRYNHFHNQYTQILVQVGTIGIALLLLIFYFMVEETRDRKFATLIVVAILLSFMGDVLLSRQFSIALISTLIAIILRKDSSDISCDNSLKC